MFLRLIPILIHHFTNPIPHMSTLVSSSPATEIIDGVIDSNNPIIPAYHALANGLRRRFTPNSTHELLLTNWAPFLHPWLGFFMEHLLEARIELFPQIFPSLCHILAGMVKINGVSKPLPGFTAIAMRAWHFALATGISAEQFFPDSMHHVVHLVSAQLADSSEFVEAIRALPNFVDLLFCDLQRSKVREPSRHPLNRFILLLSTIGSLPEESPWYADLVAIHSSFSEHKPIRSVISAITQIDPWNIVTPPEEKTFLKLLQLFINYAEACMIAGGGAVSVAEAINGHLLREMAKSFPFLLRQSLENAKPIWDDYQHLLRAMASFHPHPIVFRAVRRWLKSNNPNELCDVSMPIYTEWITFHEMLEATLMHRSSYKLEKRSVCASTMCPSNPIQVKSAKQCGGCLSERYCS
ncbi:hypothetical protein C8J56DRAFT_68143 [Mycena floridula]|nr:hypothetical protein C8J56DRAFT_68143 [Mycena floridula]